MSDGDRGVPSKKQKATTKNYKRASFWYRSSHLIVSALGSLMQSPPPLRSL